MRRLILVCCAVVVCCAHPNAHAYDYESDFDASDPSTWPVIAVIIDDLGDRNDEGRRALALPGPVACSILPHTPFAAEFARIAHARGKEVLLHQPLEADANNRLLGPGAITRSQTRAQLSATLRANLDTIAHVSGVNNHMGSLLTRHAQPMSWLMSELKSASDDFGDLFFVDSVTTGSTLAQATAQASNIANARRDVFLDHVQDSEHVAVQFEALKSSARRQGYAVGIGHPFTVTLQMLNEALPRLPASGYRLVSVRELIRVRDARQGGSRALAGLPATHETTYQQK